MELPVPTPVRTLLVSDVHLGCKHSRAGEFLDFIQQFAPDTLYLVGDFIDTWKINTGWHWSAECDQVISHLVSLADQGTKILYVPGNHDAVLRNPDDHASVPVDLCRFDIANEFVMETLAGWRFLITHGDLFDRVESKAQWISKSASTFYDSCLSLNWYLHKALMSDQRNPYGICAVLKRRVKQVVRYFSNFETKILDHARSQDCDGVICGHIHTPDIVQGESMWYCNTGDWVENCTGLVELHDGQIHLVRRYGKDMVLDLPDRPGQESSFGGKTGPPIAVKDSQFESTAPASTQGFGKQPEEYVA